jgi:hypothetical protein
LTDAFKPATKAEGIALGIIATLGIVARKPSSKV